MRMKNIRYNWLSGVWFCSVDTWYIEYDPTSKLIFAYLKIYVHTLLGTE